MELLEKLQLYPRLVESYYIWNASREKIEIL